MNQLRDFAGSDGARSTTTTTASYSKDGKTIVESEETNILGRWGVWASADGFLGGGHNTGGDTIGFDYRVRAHWLIGAYGSYWYNTRSSFGGGIYTAFYARRWWGVLGGQFATNDYTGFASSGYDFQAGPWLFGPVLSIQFDSVPVDTGFGQGNLFQTRAGGRLAYTGWHRFRPEIQVMYENQAINNDPNRSSNIWVSIGGQYQLSERMSLFGFYSFDGNTRYEISQVNLGIRCQF